ncbi:MAG: serine--tRNA ligase, partial [Microcoleaceae cyanobacterium]
MLDIKLIRENPQQVQDLLNRRNTNYDLQPILQLDQQQRQLEQERSQLQERRNTIGALVGEKMKGGTKPDDPEILALKEEGNQIKDALSNLEPQEKEIKDKIIELLLPIPNIPSESVPAGLDENENVEVKRWGDEYIPTNKNILPHYEIGEKLGILDFERGVKIAQSRFVTIKGVGAALERAIIQFMLDRHTQHGYVEVIPPLLVNTKSLTATGQLPKFAEESFKCSEDDLWLIPTSEVPVMNLYRDEIINGDDLPIYHC